MTTRNAQTAADLPPSPSAEPARPSRTRQARAMRPIPTWLLLAPALIYLAAAFGVPLFNTFWTSISDPSLSLDNYHYVFTDPVFLKVYLRTVAVALSVTGLCLLLGYPLAYYMARKGGLAATVLLGVTGLCFWISFLVRTYAWTVILGKHGPYTQIAEWFGVQHPPVLLFTTAASLIAMTHILLPYMVLTLYVALAKIDVRLIRAAHSLGAGRHQTFWRVIAPLSVPGIVSGSLLVFIFCIGFYVTPTLLGSPHDMMISSLISDEIESALDFGSASALSMVLLAAIMIMLFVYDRVIGLERIGA